MRLFYTLHSPELRAEVRLRSTAFVRNPPAPFAKLLTRMLSGMSGSVQRELDRLAGTLNASPKGFRAVSAQALSNSRMSFSAKAFHLLNRALLRAPERDWPVPRWNDWRVVVARGLETAVVPEGSHFAPGYLFTGLRDRALLKLF